MIQLILDFLSGRVKNLWLGSIFFVFIAINWQPLMYLFLADKDLTIRFNYFDKETDLYTLLLCPILVGFALSVAKLFITLFHIKVCWWVTSQINAANIKEDTVKKYMVKQGEGWMNSDLAGWERKDEEEKIGED